MSINDEIEPDLLEKLTSLKSVPVRDPEKEKQGLVAFLKEASGVTPSITPEQNPRHNRWIYTLPSIFTVRRKEHSPMLNMLMTIIAIASLVLGGDGVAAAATQKSQPDQALYSFKLMSEDVRLSLSKETDQKLQLALDFADRRAAEINLMFQNGNLPSPAVRLRYQNQIEQMLQIALKLSDDLAVQALSQIQIRLKQQEQAFMRVQSNDSTNLTAVRAQIMQMVQERISWAEAGLEDPTQLRDQLQLRDQQQEQNREMQFTPSSQIEEPGAGPNAGNPWTTDTPTPGSGYGPGPGLNPTVTCTPIMNQESGTQATKMQQNQPTQAGPQSTNAPDPGRKP